MALPTIIGITGKKYSGKDTIANYLVNDYWYEKMAYASPLKETCRILFGFNDDQLYGTKKEEIDERWAVAPRKVFQYIGTDLFRKQMNNLIPGLNDGFWVKCLSEQIKLKLEHDPNSLIVVSDIRFQNEIDELKKLHNDVLIIRVTRPSLDATNKSDTHDSENMIDKLSCVDYDVVNDSDIESLYNKINEILYEGKK